VGCPSTDHSMYLGPFKVEKTRGTFEERKRRGRSTNPGPTFPNLRSAGQPSALWLRYFSTRGRREKQRKNGLQLSKEEKHGGAGMRPGGEEKDKKNGGRREWPG